jgi:hypothetical protein
LNLSNNDYDWLGNGIYFWENDHERALEYACLIKQNPKRSKTKIIEPSVIGAIIDLGNCFNLLEHQYLELLKVGYDIYKQTQELSGLPLLKNSPVNDEKDLLLRKLDCAVIETIHDSYKEQKKEAFDTVRAVFSEGKDLYPNAGFKEKNHIQICVRNPACIKGYFIPLK